MHPILFEIGHFPIRSYGVMLALAFLVGISLSRYDARRVGVGPDAMSDLGFWIILSAVIGSRVFYTIFYDWTAVRQDPLEFFRLWHGGLVLYGGLVGSAIGGLLFLRLRRLPFITVFDLVSPATALGVGIGRIGCFLNGCCYGQVCALPIGVTFPLVGPEPRHPTQLYESAAGFLMAIVLWRLRTRITRPGVMYTLLVVGYAVVRFAIEFVRGDGNPIYGAGLSLSQWISVVVVVGAGGVWSAMWFRGRAPVAGSSAPLA